MKEMINVAEQNVICWSVDTSEYKYNTEIEIGENVVAILKFMDSSYLLKAGAGGVIKDIIEPTLEANKKKVIFEKTKVDCVLLAMNTTVDASVFWGLNIANVKDKITKKIYRLKTSGKYLLTVSNLESFSAMIKSNAADQMQGRDLKAMFSSQVLDMIRIAIERVINEKADTQKMTDSKDMIVKSITDEINLKLGKHGVAIKDFTAGMFQFVEEEAKVLEEIDYDNIF